MTILVTGGAGFIGANFVAEWLSEVGEPVINLDKLTYAGNPESLARISGDQRHTLVKGDIGDSKLVGGLLREYCPRAIINFAAESHVDRSIEGPAAFIQTNVVGTFELLETARSYFSGLATRHSAEFRFLHVSTDEVYGSLRPADQPFDEAARYAPNSPYSASKAAADHLVRSYYRTYGLPVLTTNCSNNYGPLQHPEKFIPVIISSALAARPIPVYGKGQNVRDWLHVSDHCAAVRTVVSSGKVGETYNVGGSCELSNIELATTVCRMLDELSPAPSGRSYAELISFVADRPGHDFRYAIQSAKLSELGWQPRRDFETGLRETVAWYIENREWTSRLLQRLGSSSQE